VFFVLGLLYSAVGAQARGEHAPQYDGHPDSLVHFPRGHGARSFHTNFYNYTNSQYPTMMWYATTAPCIDPLLRHRYCAHAQYCSVLRLCCAPIDISLACNWDSTGLPLLEVLMQGTLLPWVQSTQMGEPPPSPSPLVPPLK